MCVLIEALTLVVPKKVLDVSFPGGTDACLQAFLKLETPPRFICGADARLINVSFYNHEHLRPALDLLRSHGIVDVDDNRFVEMAVVEQGLGPTMPCDWVRGVLRELQVIPAQAGIHERWTPAQSRALVRSNVRDEPGRCLRLAVDGDVETWLDFATGEVSVGLPQREPERAVCEASEQAQESGVQCPGVVLS